MVGLVRAVVLIGAVAVVTAGFTGCDSTQLKNQRAKIAATRELQSRKVQAVGRKSPDVVVKRTAFVSGSPQSAVVVELQNRSDEPQTDVPVAVGVRLANGRRELLNRRRGLDWFQTHLPSVAASSSALWIFQTKRRIRRGERVFALAGRQTQSFGIGEGGLPKIDGRHLSANSPTRTALIAVKNSSGVPQKNLQVYAVVRHRGKYLAAGKRKLPTLEAGKSAELKVPLIGRAGRYPVTVQIPPTVFA